MKTIFLTLLLISSASFADISTMEIKGKIKKFDQKIVTIEFMGEEYNFKRDKLGPAFKGIKAGDEVTLNIEKTPGEQI